MHMPPEIEQIRITNFLYAQCAELDNVLEKTRASIEEYKKLKQAVITQAVTKGIRSGREKKDSGVELSGLERYLLNGSLFRFVMYLRNAKKKIAP